MSDNWIKCPQCSAEVRENYLPKHIKKAHDHFEKYYSQEIDVKSEPSSVDKYKIIQIELDKYQKDFCNESSRSIRLLAPAGSGKTHSLLWRCLSVSQNSNDESNVRYLVFTFTRAARDELRERLKNNSVFQPIMNFIEISTLNAWGLRRLKTRINNLRTVSSKSDKYFCMTNLLQPIWQKYPAIKQVMTDSRRRSKAAQQLMDLVDKLKSLGFRHDKHSLFEEVEKHVYWMKENGMSNHFNSILQGLHDLEIIDVNKNNSSPIKQFFDNFYLFWKLVLIRMYETAMLTIEDQKYWSSIDLGKAIEEGRYTTGMHRYQHILVDEFQDVNPLDLELLKNIAKINKAKLCIIGDDDQAIYEWRGATPQFILDPDKHIEDGYKTFVLEKNYRSPKNIVEISQRLIQHNFNRVAKSVKSESNKMAQIEVIAQPSLEKSVDYVLKQVKFLLNDNSIKNIAIISRKRSQIIPYQIVFASHDIEFYAAEDLHILLSETFKGLKEMLLLKRQADINLPYAPEPIESLLKLCDKVKRYPLSNNDKGNLKNFLISKRPKNLRYALELLYEYKGQLKGQNSHGSMSESFYNSIDKFLSAGDVADAVRAISDNFDGLQKDYGKSLDDIFYADPPFLYLSDYAERYGDDYELFFEDIEKAILTLAKIPNEFDDEIQLSQDNPWHSRLHLMTALRAKGKEFDVVFILDCNTGVFPNKFAQNEADIEAERRLFYVAITRARKNLIFLVNNKMFGESVSRSPFLTECGL